MKRVQRCSLWNSIKSSYRLKLIRLCDTEMSFFVLHFTVNAVFWCLHWDNWKIHSTAHSDMKYVPLQTTVCLLFMFSCYTVRNYCCCCCCYRCCDVGILQDISKMVWITVRLWAFQWCINLFRTGRCHSKIWIHIWASECSRVKLN